MCVSAREISVTDLERAWPGWRNSVKSQFQGDPMATPSVDHSEHVTTESKELISFEEAMGKLSREERFRATVYSMNTLLVQKGIYSPEEFEFQFRQFAQKNLL
jgi:hypothetical protein